MAFKSWRDVEFRHFDPQRRITVQISKVGGGHIGHRYDGRWEYAVLRAGTVLIDGDDFATGTPKTHREAAVELLAFLDEEV
jgi:hypothetical protein